MKERLRRYGLAGGDYIVILIAAATIFFSLWPIISNSRSGGALTVRVDAEADLYLYALPDAAGHYIFNGPLGKTVVQIEEEGAYISDSPCPDKSCIAAGALDSPGAWTACLPNQVMLSIVSGGSVDAESF